MPMDLLNDMGMTPEEYFEGMDKDCVLSMAYSDGGRERYVNGGGSITACCAKAYKKMSKEAFIALLRNAPGELSGSWLSGLSKKEIAAINGTTLEVTQKAPKKVATSNANSTTGNTTSTVTSAVAASLSEPSDPSSGPPTVTADKTTTSAKRKRDDV